MGTGSFRDVAWLTPQLPGGASVVVLMSTLDDLHIHVRALCIDTLLQRATQAERQVEGEL